MSGASARQATRDDLADVVYLYRLLAAEMIDLRSDWGSTGALPEPVEGALGDSLAETVIGLFDDVPVGFVTARISPPVCTVIFLYTRPEARGVGVGEAMMGLLRTIAKGITSFDVPVLPGHRAAKNFLEGEGFKARLIIMRSDV